MRFLLDHPDACGPVVKVDTDDTRHGFEVARRYFLRVFPWYTRYNDQWMIFHVNERGDPLHFLHHGRISRYYP